MNIFQTIWSALTTENVTLTNIIGIPSIIIETTVFMLYFTLLLNIAPSKQRRIQYILLVSILGMVSRYLIPTPFGTYINLISIIICAILILHISFFKCILALIIPFLLTSIIESVIVKVYPYVLHINYMDGINIPLNRLVVTLVIYLILYLIYLAIKGLKLTIPKLEILNKKKRVLLAVNIVFGLLLIAAQIFIMTFYSVNIPFGIVFMFLLSLFIYLAISIYTVFTTSELEETTMKLEEANLYNKTLQILHDNIRAFKHDFFNIVQGIGGYISKNDMDGLKEYYNKLLEDCQQVNNLSALSPSVVNNPAVYNILANKYHIADENGIKINLEVFMDLNELNINSYELTRILGILINNAIEASKECDDKTINICFREDKRKHMQIIVIENTYNNKDVNTEKIFEKGYTTKSGNTGIGLWEVRQIMKKHNNLNLFTTKSVDFFNQQFEIYY